MFIYKSVTTVKSTALDLYFVHGVSVKYSAKHPRWLTENEQTVVNYLQVIVGSEWKEVCSNHGGWSSVYGFTHTEEDFAEETQ